ncbi:hypothetical protein [Sorangium sp. So ce362]|uniref:hypothetical protein n=1 Tax=Sorangium sp. So ce362 TaxID=3133303 RepID=UPI003F615463
MKLVKALGALALFGLALGAVQLAAAEDTIPIQDLVIVEETTSPALADARIPPDDLPYHRPFRPYGDFRPYRPFIPHRPFRPYGHFRPHRPFGPHGPFHPYGHDHGRSEATPAGDLPTPAVNLRDRR